MCDYRLELEKAFAQFLQAKERLFNILEYWLYTMPLLKDEGTGVIGEIFATAKKKILEQEIKDNIIREVTRIARNKLTEHRRRREGTYDPQLADKLPLKIPEGFDAGDLLDPCLRRLKPFSRLLIGLKVRGLKNTEIAGMLRVTSGQVSHYFEKVKEEIKRKCKEI